MKTQIYAKPAVKGLTTLSSRILPYSYNTDVVIYNTYFTSFLIVIFLFVLQRLRSLSTQNLHIHFWHATCHIQLTREIEPMLGYYWPNVSDSGPILQQYQFSILCLVEGRYYVFGDIVSQSPAVLCQIFVYVLCVLFLNKDGYDQIVKPKRMLLYNSHLFYMIIYLSNLSSNFHQID